MIQVTLKCWPLRLTTGELKNVSIFSAVQEISRTFKIVTPTTSTPPRSGVGVKTNYWFSGQFMTFPGLLNFWPPKILPGTTLGWGGSHFFLCENDSHIYPNMRAKFACGPTVVSKKKGVQTHTQTYKGTLQLYSRQIFKENTVGMVC